MGHNIPYFAGPSDHVALSEFIANIGLRVVPPCPEHLNDPDLSNPAKGPCCLLSFLDPKDLHPYGKPPQQVSEAVDPLLAFARAYYSPPYLVAGCISWSDDVTALAKQTKPYFNKLLKWFEENWRQRREDNYFIGPEADGLVQGAAQPVYFPPGTKIREVPVGREPGYGAHGIRSMLRRIFP